MMAAQFNLDVAGQLQDLLPQFNYIVPLFIIKELKNIQERSRGKTRNAAATALKIAVNKPLKIKNIPQLEDEPVDDALLRISKVLCTNDRELRKKARENKIPVIYLRQRKYLAVDGYLS
jgi:uncharacterized protein